MSKRVTKVLSILLVLSMVSGMAGCSKIEEFFDLGSSHREHRNRDDDDTDETEETEETEETQTGETDPTFVPSVAPSSNGLTYPDHIPTYEEIHPAHPNGTVSGQDAVDILNDLESQIITEVVGSSYVDAEIYFDDYESLGITFEEGDIGWGEVLPDHSEDGEIQEALDQLYSIDRDSLSTGDRIFYDKLLNDLELSAYAAQYTAFDYYESVLKALVGPQCEILFICEVLEFDTVEDAENYILVLRDMDRYFDDMCTFEEQRAAYGYVNSDDIYEEVAESFDNLVAQSEDCFLYDTFQTRLDNIEGLTDQEREALIEEHDQVMHDIVFPEFEECAERMRALKCGAPSVGVCSYPGGDAYFAYRFAVETNSGRTIDESITQLEAYADTMMDTMYSIAYGSDNSWMQEYLEHDYSVGDAQDNLDYLYEQIQEAFPPIPAHAYRLMTVPEVFADDFSPAAFLGYHLDTYDSNIIITNETDTSRPMGINIAHEGYPGHMYESVYHRAVTEHPYMYLSASIGYAEGWATYVQDYSYRYFSTSPASTIVDIEDQLNAILFARFDLGVNYEGWDAQDCADWYGDLMGMSVTADAITDAYNIILSNPCYGAKYGVSFINTGMVIAQLHNDFPDASEVEIHTAYLNAQEGTFEQILENAEVFLSEGDLSAPVSNYGDPMPGYTVTPSGPSEETEETEQTGSGSGGSLWGN